MVVHLEGRRAGPGDVGAVAGRAHDACALEAGPAVVAAALDEAGLFDAVFADVADLEVVRFAVEARAVGITKARWSGGTG